MVALDSEIKSDLGKEHFPIPVKSPSYRNVVFCPSAGYRATLPQARLPGIGVRVPFIQETSKNLGFSKLPRKVSIVVCRFGNWMSKWAIHQCGSS
jgi:hypothetical protein